MKRKISKLQIFRYITQIVFLIFFPGLFTLTFSGLKGIYEMIIKGNTGFIQLLPQLSEFLAIIPLALIFGRFFCGWFCAFGTFNDFLYIISSKVFKIKFKISEEADAALKYVKYLVLAFLVYFVWTEGSTLFANASPWDAFAQIPQFFQVFVQFKIGFLLLVLIAVGAIFIERFFCRYLCPLGAVFSIVSKVRIFDIDKPTGKCGKCRICTNNCSMGIPLYKSEKVRSGECINCLRCTSVCPRKNPQAAILDQNLNSAFASTVAIAAFAGVYSLTSMAGLKVESGNEAIKSSSAAMVESPSSTASTNSLQGQYKDGAYKDGTYTGTGEGHRYGLQVAVTIKNSKITDVEILSSNETRRYAEEAFSVVPQEITQAQSTNVDIVSGATESSDGIIQAVQDALSQAKA